MKRIIYLACTLLLIILLCSCGGGSSVSGNNGTTTLTGVVAKGLFVSGTVTAYALINGQTGQLLGQSLINTQGGYTLTFSGYTGPVLLEANGRYLDEISASNLPVSGLQFLRAAIPNAIGTMTVCITPLTEVAVDKALQQVDKALQQSGLLTAQNIAYANDLVENIFKIDDILQRIPVPYTGTALQNASTEAAEYTMVLAAISQLAQGSSADNVIDNLKASLAGDIMSAPMAASLGGTINQLPLSAATNDLNLIGTKKVGVTIRLQSTLAAINLANLTLNVPATHNLPTIATGTGPAFQVLEGYVVTSANISFSNAGYDPVLRELNLILVAFDKPFTNGDLFTVYFDLPAGTQPTLSYTYKDLSVLGINQSSTNNTLTARDAATGEAIAITQSLI